MMSYRRVLSVAICLWSTASVIPREISAQPLRPVRDLRIDGHSADLVPIHWLVVRTDGAIAVSQGQDGLVRFFSADGRPLAAVGGKGDGPGEFRTLARAGLRGDTVWVYDGRLKRFSMISRDLQIHNTFQAPLRASSSDRGRVPDFRTVHPLTLDPTGAIHALVAGPDGRAAAAFPDSAQTYARLDRHGSIRTVMARIASTPSEFYVRTTRGAAGGLFPFPIVPFYAAAPDGSLFVQLQVVPHAGSGTVNLVGLRASGDTAFKRSYSVQGVRIPKSVGDSAVEATAGRWKATNPEVAAAYRQQAVVPPIYPPVLSVVVGTDGWTWIQLRETNEGQPYWILDENGASRGTVVLPAGTRILQANRDYGWGTEADEFDVESVVRYRIQR